MFHKFNFNFLNCNITTIREQVAILCVVPGQLCIFVKPVRIVGGLDGRGKWFVCVGEDYSVEQTSDIIINILYHIHTTLNYPDVDFEVRLSQDPNEIYKYEL